MGPQISPPLLFIKHNLMSPTSSDICSLSSSLDMANIFPMLFSGWKDLIINCPTMVCKRSGKHSRASMQFWPDLPTSVRIDRPSLR